MEVRKMNFLEAVQEMKKGKQVEKPDTNLLQYNKELEQLEWQDGSVFCGQIEFIEATDWRVVGGKKWNMSFIEAGRALRAGKKVRREHWAEGFYIHKPMDNTVFRSDDKQYSPHITDFEAKDWEILT